MKGVKTKYLIIDANDIVKQLYRIEREFTFNDFDNIYYKDGIINGVESFKKNNIPQKFQKIIIKLNSPFAPERIIKEYLLGLPFRINGIEEIEGQIYIKFVNKPRYYDGQTFNDEIFFKTRLIYSSIDDVKRFLKNMRQEGYLELYLQSLNDLFKISSTRYIEQDSKSSYGFKNA